MTKLVREFKCPNCGEEECTSAYYLPGGEFSYAYCFNCNARFDKDPLIKEEPNEADYQDSPTT